MSECRIARCHSHGLRKGSLQRSRPLLTGIFEKHHDKGTIQVVKGRVGIHELMTNSEELTRGLNEGAETAELKRIAMRNGMRTLHQDSILKVKEGTSTVLEAISNVPPDMIKLEQ